MNGDRVPTASSHLTLSDLESHPGFEGLYLVKDRLEQSIDIQNRKLYG